MVQLVHLFSEFLKLQRNPLNYALLKTGAAMNLSQDYWREQFVEFKVSSTFYKSLNGPFQICLIQNAVKELTFSTEEMEEIFKILAIILKIGNIKFQFNVNFDGTTGCSIQDEYGKQK